MIDSLNRSYPKEFNPEALWNSEEIRGYLSIGSVYYYEIEAQIPTFKIGRRRVAFARDVINYAKKLSTEQNPHLN